MSEAVEQELTEKLGAADERLGGLRKAIVALGGVPDVLGELLVRVGTPPGGPDALGSLDEALLAHLALQHQLVERARYAKVLAQTAGETGIVRLAKRVESAHVATAAWLSTRLGELATGGVVDLRPTRSNQVAGLVATMATMPSRRAISNVNGSVAAVGRWRARVAGAVTDATGRARRLAGAAANVYAAGRDALLAQAEDEAAAQDAPRAVEAIHRARTDLGALLPEELPIEGYDELTVAAAAAEVRALDDAGDVRAVLAFEAANRNRKRVMEVGQARLAELGSELISA
jgi:hypothetical protein